MSIRFGECVLDSDTRELSRRGKVVAISPKALRLLEILLERRPKVVSKEMLHELLWPGVFVAEGNLPRLMSEVRGAIADGRSRWVRTVHRFGYAFSGDAQEMPDRRAAARRPIFRLFWGQRAIPLADGDNDLGRDEASDVWIDVHSVSRRHARISIRGRDATLRDLGSKNGTFHGGKRLLGAVALEDGDEIRIGTVPLTFRRSPAGGSTRTTRVR